MVTSFTKFRNVYLFKDISIRFKKLNHFMQSIKVTASEVVHLMIIYLGSYKTILFYNYLQ